ncbi:hypothetical protein ZEAMMB73_Zm00001d028042 [Zea mays]|uniref:Ubiquitin-like protease family profile domain-containing protein n=1 Tax=Zea mays TaxID=4577 RepID=A0A1R3LE38_MAIZE|nr:hypothetical protein ZEAMMB73_Zm00001d028042 [Zea mays]
MKIICDLDKTPGRGRQVKYGNLEFRNAAETAYADYICTQGDLALIDFIKEIPCEPRVEVVLIDDAFVERKSMECLFQLNAYLDDEVIDCYINLIKAQKHLKCRSGGHVLIENAFQFNFLKRDGDVEIRTKELYPIKDMAQICSAERRVLLYLDHDMVFIPINIRETHWYLVVIHSRNMEIQVLDSLGTSQQDRKDLTDCVRLQRQTDMIYQRKELKDHRWPDLQVASWPLKEIEMAYAKQTYSSSCGLFLLNYIEYWTGDELSDSFTQTFVILHYRMTWVRSFNPFKIEISVKDLQNILTINQDMTLRCFDMAVRHFGCLPIKSHRMVGFGKLPKYHQDPTAERFLCYGNSMDVTPFS